MLRRVAIPVLSLSIVVGSGCKDGSPPAAAGDGGVSASSASAGPRPGTEIEIDDCEKWATHALDVIITDWKDAASRCPPEVQTTVGTRLDGQRPTVHRAALDVCSKHIGEYYPEADGRCFMKASTAKALADCHFAPMTNPGDSDIAGEIERMRAMCAQAPPAAGAASHP